MAVNLIVFLFTGGSLFCAASVMFFVAFSMMWGLIGYFLLCRLAWFDSFLSLNLFVAETNPKAAFARTIMS